MAKQKTVFECQSCGFKNSKWIGKCPNCGSWESFVELNEEQVKFEKQLTNYESKAIPITDIKEDNVNRFSSNDTEFDLVLGGGIVPGSLTLIGGSPGVGKSTLLLKISGNLAKSGKKILYVSGEESSGQIKLRALRVDANHKNLYLLAEINLEKVIFEFKNGQFDCVVIDSIQTLYSENVSSAPVSVSQVREITFELMRLAKESLCAMFIIGHITKEGSIAGPRVLEHMVDCVLYFEGDSSREIRMLRGFKNRFGSTSEIGIFEMTEAGLVSAKDISSKFFKKGISKAGSALSVIMEGSRALIIEVQALVSDNNYSHPKRVATGFDLNRLNMILALLEKKLELPFNQYDVFINISGGLKISETGADLAVVAAILSSFRNRSLNSESIFIGEISLIGDIREVYNLDIRLKEAKNHGFTKAIIPKKPSSNIDLKIFEVDEVSKIVEWM
ncbi:MAG: DNA repair protein RadA [Campylobacterales bacterium]|nr:DNA repair protein RadA [Campylobacterales bacterium]